jgi:hypothetical protein
MSCQRLSAAKQRIAAAPEEHGAYAPTVRSPLRSTSTVRDGSTDTLGAFIEQVRQRKIHGQDLATSVHVAPVSER